MIHTLSVTQYHRGKRFTVTRHFRPKWVPVHLKYLCEDLDKQLYHATGFIDPNREWSGNLWR